MGDRIKHALRVSVVNFHPLWGNKALNLERIADTLEAEAKAGASFIVFPEMALTGYDTESGVSREERMQVRLAEPVPGPASAVISQITKEYGVYTAMGMPEQDPEDPAIVYNSVMVCGPEGLIGTYRKIHVPPGEACWASRGNDPLIIHTPWGPVGFGICYDVYVFPELTHYYRAKGVRLLINSTAINIADPRKGKCQRELESISFNSMIFIASANLTGLDRDTRFNGGSNIIGPSTDRKNSIYYVGRGFHSDDPLDRENIVLTATIDLTETEDTHLNLFRASPAYGEPDLRFDLYAKWFEELMHDETWLKNFPGR
ncbi:MAG: carbon-nitrogen hydrolase family protein [Oscillospiraceae bacterium]|nr:carbon-nitrogen hydrolase family protein [Oscillospiraceae bacterium]